MAAGKSKLTKSNNSAKAAPKAKKTATPKETGGGGGIFEEKVVAYFLADLLTGRASFDEPNGKISQVDTQRPAAIRPLDDLLLTIETPGQTRRVAFSIKSNQQFTAQGFPADFVRSAWEQILTASPDMFDPSVDFIGFITSPLAPDYARDLSDLLNRAWQQAPTTLAQEINLPGLANARIRKLYQSFACPPDIAARYAVGDTLTGRGLSRLICQSFDFEEQQSQRAAEVRNRLRAALMSGSATEAAALWDALCLIGKKLRPHAGRRTLAQLADELRHKFRLNAFPEHRTDWVRMREAAETSAQQVPAFIGGHLTMARASERAKVANAFDANRALVLRGASGIGKSVVARMELLARATQGQPVLWLDAETLRGKTLAGLRLELGLTEGLPVLLQHITASQGLCVIDRLDKVYDQTFGLIASILKLLRLDDPESPWQLLMPCVGEEWERVQSSLLEHGIVPGIFKLVDIEVPDDADRQQVWAQFPQLAALRLRPHLNDVLLRPKMLDILARSIAMGQLLDDVVGETSVAGRWLHNLMEQGTVKQYNYAASISTIQADTWQSSIPNSELPPLNSEAVEELTGQRVFVKRAGRVSFEHDLYGDWLRLDQLRQEARKGTLVPFLAAQRLSSPLWQRAVRLYGVALLDEQPNVMEWEKTYVAFAPLGEIGQDLLLEATWYTADPVTHLTALWPLLIADDGALLQRLLTRFMHAATRPNERVLKAIAPEATTLHRAATWFRIPIYGYWPQMLRFLYQQRTALSIAVSGKVADVVYTWLSFTPIDSLFREEAAAIAVVLGEVLLKHQQEHGMWAGGLGKNIWPAILASAVEEPSQVALLTLEAAGRRPQRFLPPPSPSDPDRPRRKSIDFSGPQRPQWPTGPARRVDDELQKLALEPKGLELLLWVDPASAYELALALLIEEPKSFSDRFDNNFGLERIREWQGAHYDNGPFLLFLEHDEALGINLILELEKRALIGYVEEGNHSSWYSANLSGEPVPPPFVMPTIQLALSGGERTFQGDDGVYGWHRGEHPSSPVMTGALMALEKYLYNRLDAGDDINQLLGQLLTRASSVAILGTLALVGKCRPELLLEVLQPLLGSPELLQWDFRLVNRLGLSGDFFGLVDSQKRREELREWQKLPHREISLLRFAQSYFIKTDEGKAFFAAAQERWSRWAATTQLPDAYEESIHYFNPANHTEEQISPTHKYVTYIEPAEKKAERTEWESRQRLDGILFSTATKRHQLDDTAAGPLPDAALEQLWQEAELLTSATEGDQGMGFHFSRPADVKAGIAALLLLRGRQWLAQYPAREAWCREVTLSGAQTLWEKRNEEKDDNTGISGLSQTDYQADAMPLLWAEQPEDEEVRRAVGQWMLVAPVICVRRFVSRAADHRMAIGEDYFRAAHLRLLRASQWHQRQYFDGEWTGQLSREVVAENNSKLAVQRDEWLEDFLKRKLSSSLPALHTLPNHKPEKRTQVPWDSGGSRPDLPRHPFNEESMAAAFAGLPTPAADTTWLPIWQQVVVDSVARLYPTQRERFFEWGDHPHTWDPWLFGQVAQWLPLLDPVAARQLWEPIVALGVWAPAWVKDFLHKWTQLLFSQPENGAAQQVWQEMVDYALTSQTWKVKGSGILVHRLGEIWRALLGLTHSSRWQEAQRPLAESLGQRWATWAKIHVGDDDSAAALASFLVQPAAKNLVLDGLQWLARPVAYAPPNANYWNDVADPIAGLLTHVWKVSGNQLRQNAAAFDAFKKLLAVLVARQHPLGLHLNQVVGAS